MGGRFVPEEPERLPPRGERRTFDVFTQVSFAETAQPPFFVRVHTSEMDAGGAPMIVAEGRFETLAEAFAFALEHGGGAWEGVERAQAR